MGFQTLVLSGGGVTGFCHLGALSYLHEHNLLRSVDTIVSTSIGSVISVLYTIGYSPLDINNILKRLDERVLHVTDIETVMTKYGFDTGEYFMAKLVDLFVARKISPLTTLGALYGQTHKRLFITATNLQTHTCEYLSHKTHPDCRVLDAVRLSISIPMLFTLHCPANTAFCGVDGAVMDNYPLEFAIKDFTVRHPTRNLLTDVVGCDISTMKPVPTTSLESYLYNVFACVMKRNNKEKHECTIVVTLEEITGLQFNVPQEQREYMYQCGHTQAAQHIAHVNRAIKHQGCRRKSI